MAKTLQQNSGEEEGIGNSIDDIMQLDGNGDTSSESEFEYVPRPSSSRTRSRPNVANNEVDEKDDDEDEDFHAEEGAEQEDEDTDDSDFEPQPRKKAKKATTAMIARSKSSRSTKRSRNAKPKKKRTGKAKMIKTGPSSSSAFDPSSILNGKEVTAKSLMTSQILDSIIKRGHRRDGLSCTLIKKYLAEKFGWKSTTKQVSRFKNALMTLADKGLVVLRLLLTLLKT